MPKKVRSYKKKKSKKSSKNSQKKAGMMKTLKSFVYRKSVEEEIDDIFKTLSENILPAKKRQSFGNLLLKKDEKNNKKNPLYDLKKLFTLLSIKISHLNMIDRNRKLRLLEIMIKRFVADNQVSAVMEKLSRLSRQENRVNTALANEFSKINLMNQVSNYRKAEESLASRTNMSNAMASRFVSPKRMRERITSNNFVLLDEELPTSPTRNKKVQNLINNVHQEMLNNLPSVPTSVPKGGAYKRKRSKKIYSYA